MQESKRKRMRYSILFQIYVIILFRDDTKIKLLHDVNWTREALFNVEKRSLKKYYNLLRYAYFQ